MASYVCLFSLCTKIHHNAICVAFEQYKVVPNLQGFRILKNGVNIPWSLYVGLAGMPGVILFSGSQHNVSLY